VTDEEQFGNWLAGFIDGEGCFRFYRNREHGWSIRFEMLLRDDDAPILYECRDRLGIGRLRHVKRRHRGQGDGVVWTVQSHADRAVLIELLDRCPLRAKKAADYALWRQASLLVSSTKDKAHVWPQVAQLHQQLTEGRKYQR
jgi:hypothetical protein